MRKMFGLSNVSLIDYLMPNIILSFLVKFITEQTKKQSHGQISKFYCHSIWYFRATPKFFRVNVHFIYSSVVDASAKPASGFVFGNNFWLGSHDQCKYVNKKMDFELSNRFERNMKVNLLNDTSPFDVEMKVVHVKHFSPWQGKTFVNNFNNNNLIINPFK